MTNDEQGTFPVFTYAMRCDNYCQTCIFNNDDISTS